MSLLREIQSAAVDSNYNLPTLLRKCKILAAHLGNAPFKKWVESELDGYESADDLPEYRILSVNSYGNFYGAFGSSLTNAPIPLTCFPQDLHKFIKYCYFTDPISAIADLIKKNDGKGSIHEPWPAETLPDLRVYKDMKCLSAWKHVPHSYLVALLDTVRNRILNFVLEIEGEAPDAGEAPINSDPVPQEKVTQIFNTYISGNVGNVSAGGQNFSQTVTDAGIPSEELFNKLIDVISKADAESKQMMMSAVNEMRSSYGTNNFLTKYNEFMSVFSDNITVYGTILAPFLPALTQLLK